jgi:hypothetical protein
MKFQQMNARHPLPFRTDMSGKNFRVAQTGQRTNAEGKQVSNKVLLATTDMARKASPSEYFRRFLRRR